MIPGLLHSLSELPRTSAPKRRNNFSFLFCIRHSEHQHNPEYSGSLWGSMRVKCLLLSGLFASICSVIIEFDVFAQADREPSRISCENPGKDYDSDDGYKYYPVSMTCKNDCRTAPFTDCISRTKFIFGIFRLTFHEYARTCFCTEDDDLLRRKPHGSISAVRPLTDSDRARLREGDVSGKIEAQNNDYLVVTIDRACSPQAASIVDPF